jgi:creatinine amidohydrolase/Fe(II)-dependent formamide hydrolase-like protein
MAGEILRYEELTASRLADLDRENTLALMAIGPLEVHGPHLPLGTDVMVAIELQKRIIEQVRARRPDIDFLILPPAYTGSDSLPAPGSVDVDSRAIYHLLRATGSGLADQGFRMLLLTDNHGGPRHLIAIEKAARRLHRSDNFALLAPFNRLYRRMIEDDPRLLDDAGTAVGRNGDDADNHAGTNETSLMLVVAPGLISPLWKTLARTAVPERALMKRLFGVLSSAAARLGAGRLARDLVHLGATTGWVNMEPMPTYMGDPSLADAGAGERMLQAHVAEAMTMLEEVWAGKPPFSTPLLWDLRFIERSW